jgi:hypothetical protein
MNYPDHPGYSDDDYEGPITAGRATGRPIPLPSDEDLHRAEEAWNAVSFHNAVRDEGIVTAGWVPKATIDSDASLVPSEGRLRKLPRWARVAFAARCARRVLPLINRYWEAVPAEHLRALADAIRITETIAASATRDDDSSYAAHDAARSAHMAVCRADECRRLRAVTAIAGAAEAARAAVASATVADVIHAHTAVVAAVESMYQVITVGTVENLATPARDFDRLCRIAEKEKWTDDTPVPQSVFGPLWEGPPPPWWTDDVLAGLPPEPASEVNAPGNPRTAPTEDAVAPH